MLTRIWRKGKLLALLVQIEAGTATVENSKFLQKLKTEPPHDLPIPFLGIYLKKKEYQFENIWAFPCALQHYLQ